MKLHPGCRFIIAPRFHMSAEVPQRLMLRSAADPHDSRGLASAAWRAPTADERAWLLPPADGPMPEEEANAVVSLFQLPMHLCAAWQQLLEQSASTLAEGKLQGFDLFASRVVEFLAFKKILVADRTHCELIVGNPGQPDVDAGPTQRSGTDTPPRPQLWGGINLGDEDGVIVLCSITGGSDFPMVRLRLGPGEGFRLPPVGVILGSCTDDGHEPNVMLIISHDRRAPVSVHV